MQEFQPLIVSDFQRYPYTTWDGERRFSERPKSSHRTEFERDRARILHSAGLRRLGTKTQVLGPASDDFVRTRLTHTLEVAQIGRGLAQELGCEPDIVDAACLSHDLGHPPFGHNGEKALDEVARGIGGFEGNAQTFRLVSRLETKVLGPNGEHGGLNLTRATLDALTKYPWTKGSGPDPVKSEVKYGCYSDDRPVFEWMRELAPSGRRCLEAQVMDLSDDIAYSVHDLEDAVATGYCDLSSLLDESELERVISSTTKWYGSGISSDELRAGALRIMRQPFWPNYYDGTYAGQSKLKDMTSSLIGRFCGSTVQATRLEFGDGPLGRYEANLVIPREIESEIQFLKGIAVHYVMAPRELEPVYFQQRTLILDLATALYETGPSSLEEPFRAEWVKADDDAGRLRAVVDQIACLTDFSANQWHARHCGMLSTLL